MPKGASCGCQVASGVGVGVLDGVAVGAGVAVAVRVGVDDGRAVGVLDGVAVGTRGMVAVAAGVGWSLPRVAPSETATRGRKSLWVALCARSTEKPAARRREVAARISAIRLSFDVDFTGE
jgi:hypothetical protein